MNNAIINTIKNPNRTFWSVILLGALGMGFAFLVAVVPTATAGSPSWVGDIGIDYQPNHYPPNHIFNNHDVFYVGMDGSNTPVTNIYAELAQLKAAGFTVVRSYQVDPYSWIDLIRQANALGLYVIYEAAIPENGNQNSIDTAVNVLQDVINNVGIPTFQSTVVLVFAGHENYNDTNINYLTGAIRDLISTLRREGVGTVPVGTALVSGNLVTPGSPADMRSLFNASSSDAPLGFDPYPFQWGVTPADQAASNAALLNSIAWDYEQVKEQSFYRRDKPILMAETGWATDPNSTGEWANYFCWIDRQTHPCMPSVPNAAAYLQDLYSFVRTPSNTASALVFEAYDEPAKSPAHPDNAENFYGVFDTNCSLKQGNTNLLPNTGFNPGTFLGCQGFVKGTTFFVVGTQEDSEHSQPPFRVEIQQSNPTTSQDASMDVTVPTMDRSHPNVISWPYFLLFDGADINIAGVTSGASCSFSAQVLGGNITWSSPSCTDPINYPVNCTGNTCYLPWNNF